MNAIINYSLNKFVPYILVGLLIFSQLKWDTWQPYAILGFIFFIDKFSFKTGYSVAYCESRGFDLENPPK
jgi:general stress protein CsbA